MVMAKYSSYDLHEDIENLNLSDSPDESPDSSDEASNSSCEGEEEDYYIHIDILHNFIEKRHLVPGKINQFMVEQDCFDPRRGTNFPTDLMEGNESDTPGRRRELIGRGKEYYELWKVRKNFNIEAFGKMVKTFDRSVEVQVVRMIGSDHENLIFKGKK